MAIIALFGVAGSGKDTVGNLLVERAHFDPRNPTFRKEAFANPLKEMVKHAFDFSDDDLYGESKNRSNQYEQYPFAKEECLGCGMNPSEPDDGPRAGFWQSCDVKGHHLKGNDENEDYVYCSNCKMIYPKNLDPRIALRTLGTEWGRRLFRTVWIDAAFRRIRKNNPSSYVKIGAPRDPHWVITDGRFLNELERSQALGAKCILLLRGLDASTSNHASEAELRTIPREKFDHVLDNRGPLFELSGLVENMLKTLEIRL